MRDYLPLYVTGLTGIPLYSPGPHLFEAGRTRTYTRERAWIEQMFDWWKGGQGWIG